MTSVEDTPQHDNTSPAAALTTVFSMPSSCSSISTAFEDFDCMPPNFSESYWYGYAGYYSPAICPNGYASACARPSSASDGTPYGPPLDGGEDAAICCPEGFRCWEGTESWCSSTSFSVTNITSSSYLYTTGTAVSLTAYESTITPSAYGVQVRWRDVDLADLETNPLTPGASPTPPPASSTSNRGGASLTSIPTLSGNPTTTDNNGLSTGTKIGIGVGVPIAALLLASLLFLLWRLRRRRQNAAAHMDPSGSGKDLPEVHYTPLSHNEGGGGSGSAILSSPANPLMSPSYRSSAQQPPSTYPPPMSQPDYLASSPPKPYHHHHPSSSPLMSPPGPKFLPNSGPGGAAFAPAPAPAPAPTSASPNSSNNYPTYTLPALSRAPLDVPGLPQSSCAGSTTAISSGGGAAAATFAAPARSEAGGSTGSGPPQGDDAEEIGALRREAQRLRERRLRLTQMQQLDEEEERVVGRLKELEGRGAVY